MLVCVRLQVEPAIRNPDQLRLRGVHRSPQFPFKQGGFMFVRSRIAAATTLLLPARDCRTN
jgi:hypothetical protein